jgi:hypothetical protein
MSGCHLTESEYALEQIAVLFGENLSELNEARLTQTYQVVFGFCELENIDYLALRFLNNVKPPFETWAEEWLHDEEV